MHTENLIYVKEEIDNGRGRDDAEWPGHSETVLDWKSVVQQIEQKIDVDVPDKKARMNQQFSIAGHWLQFI